MAYSSNINVWKWIAGTIAVMLVGTILCFSFNGHRQAQSFNKERLELQDSIISLREDIVAKEEAAAIAEQQWQEVHNNHIVETKLLQAELAKVRKNYRETLAEMADLDTSELKTYFAERYGQCADTVVDSARFLLTVGVGNQIRYDLTDLDFCAEESNLKDSLLTKQAGYIGNLDTMVSVLSVEKGYYMNRAETFEQQFNTSEQARAGVQAALNKQQTITYILGGTAAILAVGLIATLIMPR